MKIKYFLLTAVILTTMNTFAQVGIGTNTPVASAALEVSSSTNNKGILIPRVTATQKDAISNPAEGLMVYQTSSPAGFYFYTGTAWKLMVTQTDLDAKVSIADATISLNTKVDKVTGKVLSSNDYTTTEKTKLAAIAGTNTGDQTTISGNAGSATKLATARNINGVAFDGSGNITVSADAGTLTGTLAVANGGTGAATAAAARSNLGLENVDNTTDLLKPISTETQTALDLKANTDTANFTKDITVNGINIGRGKGGNGSSTRIGNQALTSNTTGDSNVAIGDEALSKNTTGGRNNAIGPRSLFKNTTGGENTAIGNMALENNTSGSRNLAIGQQTLSTNTEGIKNVALGYTPLYNNTIGSNNNAIGDEALFYNTTGNNNTGMGSRAGTIISTGSQNTMIGALADVTIGTLSNATALGYQARVATSNTIQLGNTSVTNVKTSGTITADAVTYPNIDGSNGQVLTTNGAGAPTWLTPAAGGIPYTGATSAVDLGAYDLKVNDLTIGKGGGSNIDDNTAIGKSALFSNTTGLANTAIGYGALVTNTTGSFNTANGTAALFANTGGSSNTGSGANALRANTTGQENTAIGMNALQANTTGSFNTANGKDALLFNTTGSSNTANGVSSLQANTTGSFNTANGINALLTNTTGANNTAIGYAADVATAALTNATAIGAGAVVTTSNTIQLGADGTNGITAVTNVKTSGTITAGTITYPNTHNSTAGQVLITDASGIASWNTPSSSIGHYLGEAFGGGIVFYVTSDGLHGLIAETQNLSSKCFWMDAQNEISKSSNHSTAGKLFSDWRLPTANELDLLLTYSNATGLVPGLNTWYYWSSTEGSSSIVRIQGYPSLDKTSYGLKYGTDLYEVRPIRAF